MRADYEEDVDDSQHEARQGRQGARATDNHASEQGAPMEVNGNKAIQSSPGPIRAGKTLIKPIEFPDSMASEQDTTAADAHALAAADDEPAPAADGAPGRSSLDVSPSMCGDCGRLLGFVYNVIAGERRLAALDVCVWQIAMLACPGSDSNQLQWLHHICSTSFAASCTNAVKLSCLQHSGCQASKQGRCAAGRLSSCPSFHLSGYLDPYSYLHHVCFAC
jgi:hypothetical protein